MGRSADRKEAEGRLVGRLREPTDPHLFSFLFFSFFLFFFSFYPPRWGRGDRHSAVVCRRRSRGLDSPDGSGRLPVSWIGRGGSVGGGRPGGVCATRTAAHAVHRSACIALQYIAARTTRTAVQAACITAMHARVTACITAAHALQYTCCMRCSACYCTPSQRVPQHCSACITAVHIRTAVYCKCSIYTARGGARSNAYTTLQCIYRTAMHCKRGTLQRAACGTPQTRNQAL